MFLGLDHFPLPIHCNSQILRAYHLQKHNFPSSLSWMNNIVSYIVVKMELQDKVYRLYS